MNVYFSFSRHSAFCVRKQWQVQWKVTVFLVPGFQRSQTHSEDSKNKGNSATENVLLHSSLESLPRIVLRTDYFRYVLAPGDLIKGAFPFQRANETCSAEDLSEWDGSSGIPQTQKSFLIQGAKRQRWVQGLGEYGIYTDSTHSSAL